jgi:TolB-like protein
MHRSCNHAAVLHALVLALALPAADRTVMVLYFDNRTNDRDLDVLSKGLADMLVTDLSGVRGIQVVEREKLDEIVKEIDRSKTKFFDPATAQRLGKGVGAAFAITGSIAALEPKIRLDIRLIEVATAKVVMGDHVVGKKDEFFALEEALVAKFSAGLAAEGGTATSRVQSLDLLLDYSKSVDAADRGDLQGASSQMAKVVSKSPGFSLAKRKYAEILRRLHTAVEKRQDILSAQEDQLLANADAFLRGKKVERLEGYDDSKYFGYRAIRGQYILHSAAKQSKPLFRLLYRVPDSGVERVRPLLEAFYANTEALIGEIDRWKKSEQGRRAGYVPTMLERDDERRAKELEIEDPGACFGCPEQLPIDLALWTVGKSVNRTMPAFHPPLARMIPKYGEKALALFDHAMEMAEATDNDAGRMNRVVAVLDAKAKVYLALGRGEEAMASWQMILDRYPTNTQFDRIKHDLEATLGVSDAQTKLDGALAKCDFELGTAFSNAALELYEYGGATRVMEKVGAAEKACASQPMMLLAVYGATMGHAVHRGECAMFEDLAARAKRAGAPPSMADNVGAPCR